MSEQESPRSYQSRMGDTLRRAAESDDPTEFRDLLKLFASYLETEIDRSDGRAQTAIGNVELRMGGQISETHGMVQVLGEFLRDQRAEQAKQYEALLAGQAGLAVDAGQRDAELREHITLFQAEFHTLTESFVDLAERLTLLESSSKRKETQLADLRQQIVELRERTVADDLDADERREMIRTVRWLQTNMAEIAAALGLTPLERAA